MRTFFLSKYENATERERKRESRERREERHHLYYRVTIAEGRPRSLGEGRAEISLL